MQSTKTACMKRTAREKFLSIKSKQVDKHCMLRQLTQKEAAELEEARKEMAKCPLNEEEFALFEKVVTEHGGKVLPMPEEKTSPRKIMILRDLVFPYSGKAYVTYPKNCVGFLVENWEDFRGIDAKTAEESRRECENSGLIPCVVENNLVYLSKNDFVSIERCKRDCA